MRSKYRHQRTVTVRMPAALHERLTVESHRRQTSINELCLDVLHGELMQADGCGAGAVPGKPRLQLSVDVCVTRADGGKTWQPVSLAKLAAMVQAELEKGGA